MSEQGGYGNPVFDHDAADVTLVRDDGGLWHAFTTQSFYDGRLVNLPHLVSANLVDWQLVRDAMPVLPGWVRGSIWAPHVDVGGNGYVIYYSAALSVGPHHGIGVQTSRSLSGDFTDSGAPLVMRAGEHEAPFAAIDPFALTAECGRRYLYWGSGHAPIRVRELNPDGMSFRGPPRAVLHPFEDSNGHGRLVEAASVLYRPEAGYYYMWVSGDNTHTQNYAISEFRARRPTDDFSREGNPNNPIMRSSSAFLGPGHHSLTVDDSGQFWTLYHASRMEDVVRFQAGDRTLTSAGEPGVPRLLMLDRVEVRDDGWSVIGGGQPSSHGSHRPAVRG